MTKTKPTPSPPTTLTLRHPPYAYMHLHLVTLTQQSTALDDLALRAHLTFALQSYLGLSGTAIPIDILKVDGQSGWIRVPRDDEIAVVAAVSQWVGVKGISLRIENRGTWLGGVVAQGRSGKLWTLEEG